MPSHRRTLPRFKSTEEEITFMRSCRLAGQVPRHQALSGERADWAKELEDLHSKIKEIDDKIFGNPDPLPF
jgi:hypothetical protein